MKPSRILAGVLICFFFDAVDVKVGRTVNITWIGGNASWIDGGSSANWSPADEPDSDDVPIFNTDNVVQLGSNNTVAGLTMSNSIELDLNGNTLGVAGLTSLTGTGTRLVLPGATSVVNGQDITINSNATVSVEGGSVTSSNITINNTGLLFLDGGSVTSSIAGAGNAAVTIAAGGALSGNGEFSLTDAPAATTTLINNNGTLTASNPSVLIITPPTAATLHLSATDVDTRIDLDGSSEVGAVVVARNQTLDIDIPLADIFNGSISMSQNTKLDVSSAWILGALATINVDNGATGGIGGAAAGTSTIAGSSFSQNSGTITVVDTDGTLQFDAPFTMNGGTLTNNGHVIFNQTATVAAAANLDMVGDAKLTVEASRTVTINQTNFNFDGTGAAGSVITINNQGLLNLNTTDYDSDSATNAFNGTINLNSGTFNPTTGDAAFVMDGVLNMANTAGGAPVVEGQTIQIGNDAGSLNADLNATGGGNVRILSPVDFKSDADVNVGASTTLNLENTVSFNTVNGGNSAEFTGTGSILFFNTVNVNEAVILNMTGGGVTLDGIDGTGNVINIDAPMAVNAQNFSDFGNVNGGGGTNTLDINNSAGTGVLTVNLDNVDGEWSLNAPGVMNLVNDNTEATLLAGNDVNINGTVNVTGDVRIDARVDIGSTATINVNTAGQPLRLSGGTLADFNTISGGTVTGVGILGADTNTELRGFGTINADIEFTGVSNLKATGGTLTLGGDLIAVNILGTADDTGVLNITNPWFSEGGPSGNIVAVVLNGGTLQGAQVTNDNATGIQGHGTITSRVINNTKLLATNGGTLVVQTAGNDNDWDGTTNTGELQATGASLEIRDNATFGFTGKVRAINSHEVFANGFALDFNPGSSIELNDQAKYRSTSSTDIGGTVTIGAGAHATIEVSNNFFLTFQTGSATTLNGDLKLVNNNINIEQGATFSGSGALIIPDGSHMVADNLANIGTLLEMEGAFRPGNFEGIGRVSLFDYQQTNTGELFVELKGTGLNQFDRLVASGDVVLDGYLNIDIDEVSPGVPFVPSLGQTFNIITGGSVSGTFDFYDISGMPNGLTFHINYLSNAVQLQVVNKPIFQADFDDDGDVDMTDYEIWRHAFNLNQLGDANGDNLSDAADYVLWRKQLGSHAGAGSGADGLGGASVPEPATIGLLAFGIGSLAWSRRKATGPRK